MGKLLSKSKSSLDKTRNASQTNPYASPVSSTENSNAMNTGVVKQFPSVHTDAVMCVHAAGKGLCLSGSKDQTLVLFDYFNGSVQKKWQGHEKEITKTVYGAEAKSYFSASRDKLIHMWQTGSTDPVLTMSGHDLVVTGLSLNGDNSLLCSGSRDNSIRLWSVETGQGLLQNSVTRNLITHVCWAHGADFVAQTGEDKEVRIWDTRNLNVAATFTKKQYIQSWCDVSQDNNYCITCSNGFQGNGCEATLWDIRTDAIVHEFKGHIESVNCCVFVPSSVNNRTGRNLVLTASNDCSVRLWDRDSAQCLAVCNIPVSGPLTSIAVYDDCSVCVSSFNTGIHVLQFGENANGDYFLEQKAQF